MLKKNTVLIYGVNGICKIVDIRKEKMGDTISEYYVLRPVYDEKTTIYVPVDNKALIKKMRKILSPDEISELIKKMSENDTIWISDDKDRHIKYKTILDEGDREGIINIIKTLYQHKEELEKNGKKLRLSDEAIMQRAEKLLHEEFALVLDIKKEEVLPFIMEQISCSEKSQFSS